VVPRIRIQQDVNRALRRYDDLSNRLGDEFGSSRSTSKLLRLTLPVSSLFCALASSKFRAFPYLFLYRILPEPHSRDGRASPSTKSGVCPQAQLRPSIQSCDALFHDAVDMGRGSGILRPLNAERW